MDGPTHELLSHLSPERKRKIKIALQCLTTNPRQGKLLQDELAGFFSYRVGSFRIIYTVNVLRKTVHVVTIGPRETIYDEIARELATKSSRD